MAPLTTELTGTAEEPADLRVSQRPESNSPLRPLTPVRCAFLADRVATVPNLVTLVRTVAAVVVAGYGLRTGDPGLLGIAFALYWTGDILDGWLARRLSQETRLGAIFDIVGDRACTSILCMGLVSVYPDLLLVVIPFFLSFMVLDTILSLAFLCWPLLSPNYFALVDRAVYRLNWSPFAKSLNTAGVIVLAITGVEWAALGLITLLVGIKIWSAVRVHRQLRARLTGGQE
ncbi:CDP-alcohol phosphatidyltransferase family protein [Nocardioides rotundus]|uniref:CDP-alcohol phosphatidyltransferase family protein n=1 Tax=Nocardioides rotundus TaxID=1774216 RepID=UPI001CC19781|nr:CDP-alcohol phosphatidyltransferase family protein [Nocardioides rotundus]